MRFSILTAACLFLLLSMLVTSSCNRDAVSLAYTNAKEEVPQTGNLIFRFNKPVMNDSLLNVWDSTEYISFDPKIPGRFRWESPDQLVFSPARPLLPATSYKAKVTPEVLRYTSFDKVEDANDIKFHTPMLALDQTGVTWVLIDESTRAAVPQVSLLFNYPVDPAELKDKLKIEVEGKEIGYSFQTVSASNEINIRLHDIKVEDKEFTTVVNISKGLKPSEGKNEIKEDISSHFIIPSPFILNIQNVIAEHDGTAGLVRVVTTQQIASANLSNYLKIDPAVTFTTEISDNGFIVRSNQFDADKAYTFQVLKGLRGSVGGVLKEDYEGDLGFGQLEADIAFTNNKAVYLSKKGAGNIEVILTNVPKIKLVVSKIYENNLVHAQRFGYYPDESEDARYASYEDESNYADATLGDVIFEKEIETSTLPKSGIARLLNISQFADRLPEFKGIYHVMVRSTEDYWVKSSRYISVSDIGMIAKEGQDKIFVFANSLKTAESMNDVQVNVYGYNNQLIGSGVTNGEGVAEIDFSRNDAKGFRPAMIIAKTGDDFNYLPFNDTRINTSRFDVGGKRMNPTGMDAFIYAERDIYRPGESVRFSVILRNSEWQSPGDIPLKFKFLYPNGKEFKSFRKNLNEEGSMESTIDLPVSAITGTYNLEVYSSNDILLSTQNFMVEEFVPDRIKVTATLDKKELAPGQSTNLMIHALNFFGPPAANRNYETDIQIKQKKFSAKKFPDYDFSLANQNTFFGKELKEGKTDASGNASITYEVPALYANMGLLQADFYTTVFDETGRPVSRQTPVEIFTQEVFFGLKNDYSTYFPLNRPVKFGILSVNKNGSPVKSTARIVMVKKEYKTQLVRSGSYFRYESQRQDKIVSDLQKEISGEVVHTYTPVTPGDYELRIYKPGASAYISKSFYSYGSWGNNYSNAFEVNRDGNIDIETDKEEYTTGDHLKLLFKAPFNGKMLVTLENNGVVDYRYIEVKNRTASMELPVKDVHLPNIYITATLIKPHEVSEIPLTVAHGFQNIRAMGKDRKMNVAITAQKSVRSRTHQKISIKAAPGSYVTLAAVDNGVLQVSNFTSPDPYEYFYKKRALQVNAYDLYPLLFPEIRARLSSTGGDAEMKMDKRVNPMPAKRIKIVSYWSGIVKTNGNGVANLSFDIPQFSGQIRLMAVAYKGNAFGSSEAVMTVADPVVVSTALPRFLSPGDTVSVPVTISNTTAKAADATSNIKVEGPFLVVGQSTQKININANSEQVVYYKVAAKPGIGVGKIRVDINSMGERFFEETELSVRPPSTLQKLSGSGSIVGGKNQLVNIPVNDFIAGSADYKLMVSSSPVAELSSHLKYLVQYPYGCTEQIISSAFPQLYYGDMASLVGLKTGDQAISNIIETVRRIKMRQLYNGALTLWENEGQEHWWTTVYAAHFLQEAKRAGFDVDNSLMETLLGYISHRLANKQTITYYYNRDQNRKIAPKEVPYSLYVLSMAGRPNISAMNYYKANTAMLSLDGRYLLSVAFALAGDRKSFNALLPGSFSGEQSVPQTGGSFYSFHRDIALALNVLLEVDPGHKQVPVMVRQVSDFLKSNQYLNTQERTFSFLALGKMARQAGKSNVKAEIKVKGKTIARIDGNDWQGNKKDINSNQVEIVTTGNGRMYYWWEAEGISASGQYIEEDNFIKVRKRFYNRNGQPITGNVFNQNELIIIGITLENAYSNPVENIVITDLLPAGFEIENPRTKEIPGMDWIKDSENPKALDVRDDRIHFFVDLGKQKQVYYYAVRAVSPGNYKMGPVSADAMYKGEIHSYHGAGNIRVVSR